MLVPPCNGRLLLHSCCAPCSGEIMETLVASSIDFTIFFYNPNIHPQKEYDLRKEENIWAGNRFMIYALFPQCNISIHVIWGKNKQNTVFATGKSIINRSSKTNIGELMLKYKGGGHHAAGTCQVDNMQAEDILQELIQQINRDG